MASNKSILLCSLDKGLIQMISSFYLGPLYSSHQFSLQLKLTPDDLGVVVF